MRAPQPSSTKNAIARVIALGQEREAIEQRYKHARSEYIEASQELGRYRVLYARIVATVPDSIDLQSYSGTHRDPIAPRLVTVGEMGLGEER